MFPKTLFVTLVLCFCYAGGNPLGIASKSTSNSEVNDASETNKKSNSADDQPYFVEVSMLFDKAMWDKWMAASPYSALEKRFEDTEKRLSLHRDKLIREMDKSYENARKAGINIHIVAKDLIMSTGVLQHFYNGTLIKIDGKEAVNSYGVVESFIKWNKKLKGEYLYDHMQIHTGLDFASPAIGVGVPNSICKSRSMSIVKDFPKHYTTHLSIREFSFSLGLEDTGYTRCANDNATDKYVMTSENNFFILFTPTYIPRQLSECSIELLRETIKQLNSGSVKNCLLNNEPGIKTEILLEGEDTKR